MEDKNIDAIKRDVSSTVDRLDSFEVKRQGDRVTLVFAVRENKGRTEFSLVGQKLDFYRMAMGVDLFDTLKLMTSHDGRIEPISAEKDANSITLTLAIGGRSGDSIPANVNHEQEVTAAYAAALESNNPDKLIEFAVKYPDSNKASMARKLADRIVGDKEYAKLKPDATIDELREFVVKNQGSRNIPDANRRIVALQKAAADKEAEETRRRAEVEAQKQRKAEEEQAKRSRALEEKKQAETVKRDREAYNQARGSIDALKAYIAEHPDGAHLAEASSAIAKLQKEAEDEFKANGGKQKLVAKWVAKPPVLDGDGSDQVWAQAQPVNVDCEPLSRRTPKTSLEIKAVHTGGTIYMRLRWRDPDEDRQYRPWIWDKAQGKYNQSEILDDAAAVMVYESSGLDGSCMLQGETFRADIWLWRAFWSGISGKASDQFMVASSDRLPRANSYVSKNGRGQVWVQNLPDKGKQGWRYDIPFPGENPAPTLPSYKPDTATGSAADVNAIGKYKDGYWTVEFSRVFDTGNEDDVAVPKAGKILTSYAVYERADRNDHAVSPLVILEVIGR